MGLDGRDWWKYLILAVADVEGNYLAVKAYQYTTITSIMLLDCFSIPCSMILSRLFLKAKYSWKHVIAAILCTIGLLILVWSDTTNEGTAGAPTSSYNTNSSIAETRNSNSTTSAGNSSSKVGVLTRATYGDLLVLGASLCYSIGNVGEEAMVKTRDWSLYLGILGFLGSCISGLQLIIFESQEIASLNMTFTRLEAIIHTPLTIILN